MKNQVKVKFMSLPENVALARVIIASFAAQVDMTLNELEEIKVAVSEAVSNAIIHGYENSPNCEVTVIAQIFADRLEIVVEDQGKGIEDLELALQPSFSTDPERMGLGFAFMQSFMNDFDVQTRVGEGTRVNMVRKLSSDGVKQPEVTAVRGG